MQEIQIRGMNADGVQVFVNGVNVNSLSLGTADVAKIPLGTIEKIEIVKGASSMLYGSGASGGVISIFTKKPDAGRMNFHVTTEAGTQGTYDLSIGQGMALSKKVSYVVNAEKKGTDGFRDNSGLQDKNASFNLLYQDDDHLKISLYGDASDRKYGIPGVKPPSGTAPYYVLGTKYYNDEAASLLNNHEDKDDHLVLQADGKVSGKVRYHVQTDYSYSQSYNYNRSIYSAYSNRTWVTNQVSGVEGNTTLKPFEGMNILLGSEYRQYDNENRQVGMDGYGVDLPATQSDYKHNLHSSALYGELEYRPADLIKFEGGIRQEDNSLFGVKNVYRYGAVVNPTRTTALKFNRGSHFKAPTMNDLFWPDDGYTKGNTSLAPETGWHTDVTLEQEFGKKLFFSAGYFNWNVKNKIAWAEDSTQPTAVPGMYYWVPTNLDTYHAKGMELTSTIGPFSNLTLGLDYTLLYAVEEKAGAAARQSMYTPRQQFKGQITYSGHGWAVSPSVRYNDIRPYYSASNMTSTPTATLPAYWLFDMKISRQLGDHFTVSLGGYNLTNKGYSTRLSSFFDYSTFASTLCSYPGAGRSFLLGVTYKY